MVWLAEVHQLLGNLMGPTENNSTSTIWSSGLTQPSKEKRREKDWMTDKERRQACNGRFVVFLVYCYCDYHSSLHYTSSSASRCKCQISFSSSKTKYCIKKIYSTSMTIWFIRALSLKYRLVSTKLESQGPTLNVSVNSLLTWLITPCLQTYTNTLSVSVNSSLTWLITPCHTNAAQWGFGPTEKCVAGL